MWKQWQRAKGPTSSSKWALPLGFPVAHCRLAAAPAPAAHLVAHRASCCRENSLGRLHGCLELLDLLGDAAKRGKQLPTRPVLRLAPGRSRGAVQGL